MAEIIILQGESDGEKKENKEVQCQQTKYFGDRAVSNSTLGTNFGLGGGIFEVSHKNVTSTFSLNFLYMFYKKYIIKQIYMGVISS